MKVLILGGSGYVGSVLSKYLEKKGDEVFILDNLLYEKGSRKNLPKNILFGDICKVGDLLIALKKADAVVNLAAISNDPASDLNPKLTWEINYKANQLISKLCKSEGKRVIYASSCSVYGFAEKGTFSEESDMGPVTLYAKTKMLSEKHYLQKGVDAIVLRFATVYGLSPKPRFDLVVNTMIGTGHIEGKIVVNGGRQWRPLVHVKDVAQAIHLALHVKNPKNRIYNVGSNKQNYTISGLSRIISRKMLGVKVIEEKNNIDIRSYKVDFSRIKKELKFKAKFTINDAVDEIKNAFKSGKIKGMQEDEYYRVKYLKKQLDKSSFIKRFDEKIIFALGN